MKRYKWLKPFQFKKGHKPSEKVKKKISESLIGKKPSEKTKRKMSLARLGKKHSRETRKKISLANSGKRKPPFTEEHKRKISESLRGKIPKNFETMKRPFEGGNKHPSWRGGKSFEPYSTDWTETLKRSIRERDHYICQLCSKEPAITVHHIDYNKKNCNPDNLITLCKKCNPKVNFNRDYWKKYFNEKQKSRRME